MKSRYLLPVLIYATICNVAFAKKNITTVTSSDIITISKNTSNDTELDERIQDYTKRLRCLECSMQILSESQSDFAQQVRYEIKGLFILGYSENEISIWLKNKYGEEIFSSYLFFRSGKIVSFILGICIFAVVFILTAIYAKTLYNAKR